MASWYSKWFGKWFSGWFYKTPTPPTPPQPPTPPAGSIQSRAPLEAPSLLSGVRAAEEEEKKRSEDEPIECVEYEDGIDGIKKADEVGCIPGAPPPPDPPYPYPRCRYVFPRKIRVVWSQSGSGLAVVPGEDIIGYVVTSSNPGGEAYIAYSTTVEHSGDYSEPVLEFSINEYVEDIVIGTNSHTLYSPWWGSSQPGLPGGTSPINLNDPTRMARLTAFDLYSLDEMKKGKVYNTETTRRAYCYLPSGPIPEIKTTSVQYQEVTVGHIIPMCFPVLDNEVNSLPTLRLRFTLSRHVYTSGFSEPADDLFTPNAGVALGFTPYSGAVGNLSWTGNYSNSLGGLPEISSRVASSYIDWPGAGMFVADADVIRGQSLVSTTALVTVPWRPTAQPFSVQFHLTW